MQRREFMALMGGAAVWPLAAHAQTPAAMPVIGYLSAASPARFASRLKAFHQGLDELGFAEGRNVIIEYRWAEGQPERLPELAAELVDRQVSVIVAPGGAPGGLAAKSATKEIPIVFEMGADPIATGMVSSLNKPGANVTGVSSLNVEVTPKRLEILREMIPAADVVGVLINPTSPTVESQLRNLRVAAHAFGVQLHVLQAANDRDLEAAFAKLAQLGARGLVVASDGYFATNSERLAALAAHHAIPAIHQSRDFSTAGGLASYGGNFSESHRQTGMYAGRILAGQKPAELPVQQITKVELLINLKAAKTLGVAVPLSLLGRADEVVE